MKRLQDRKLQEETLQQQKSQEQEDMQDKLQRIAKMRMFDDTLMNAVFASRIVETQVLIQIILGRDDIRVISTKTQEEFIIENKITELGDALFQDGGHIIYINGEYRNLATPIGQLMHDFSCTQASDILNPVLRERVRYLKESKGGNAEMCELVEEYAEKKAKRKKREIAKNFINNTNLSLEEIAKCVELPLATVKELSQGRTA